VVQRITVISSASTDFEENESFRTYITFFRVHYAQNVFLKIEIPDEPPRSSVY